MTVHTLPYGGGGGGLTTAFLMVEEGHPHPQAGGRVESATPQESGPTAAMDHLPTTPSMEMQEVPLPLLPQRQAPCVCTLLHVSPSYLPLYHSHASSTPPHPLVLVRPHMMAPPQHLYSQGQGARCSCGATLGG